MMMMMMKVTFLHIYTLQRDEKKMIIFKSKQNKIQKKINGNIQIEHIPLFLIPFAWTENQKQQQQQRWQRRRRNKKKSGLCTIFFFFILKSINLIRIDWLIQSWMTGWLFNPGYTCKSIFFKKFFFQFSNKSIIIG